MTRAALRSVVLAVLAAVAAATPAQAGSTLAPAGTPQFPERSYRLSVPERSGLGAQDVTVTENGDPVSRLSVTSAQRARDGEFGSILVIDASGSMHGKAIREATEAARILAAQRRGAQQLGIIAFNQAPRVLLAPTADQIAIDGALAHAPRLAPQTHLFDAVDQALTLLERARIRAGSVVVLSDGSDTGSQITGAAVAARARKANVSVSTVGLRSGAFDSGELKDLAAAGRGRYIPAGSVRDLRDIFRTLGAQLASDYLVSYRSFAQPGRDVTVAVRVRDVDGLATSRYRVPGGATFVQVKSGFWTSGPGAELTAVLCALLLALALWFPLARTRRRPSLRQRVRGFVSSPEDDAPAADAMLTGPRRSTTERSLERLKWWGDFKLDVEIAGITATPVRIFTSTVIGTFVAMFLLARATGIPLVGLFALVVPWGVRTWIRVRSGRQRALFADQLPEMLQGAASAIRAGHGLVAALATVAEDAPQPSRREFERVVAEEALGVPLEEALRGLQERMDNREVLQIALVAQVQREAGGNMAEVLDRIVETLRERAELRRMVKALTAQGRLSRWVVTGLPLGLLLVITVLNPHYVQPLYTTVLGVVMLGGAAAMMATGSMVIGRIVDFKV